MAEKGGAAIHWGARKPKSAARLTSDQKHQLLNAVWEVSAGDHDTDKLVRKVAQRLDRVGLSFPGVEVRWEGLCVETDVPVSDNRVPTLTSAALGLAKALMPGTARSTTKAKCILNNVSGVLRPGRMCLLLGPPGSGKTTLLKALAGQAQKAAPRVTGSITYNGLQLGTDFVAERAAAATSILRK